MMYLWEYSKLSGKLESLESVLKQPKAGLGKYIIQRGPSKEARARADCALVFFVLAFERTSYCEKVPKIANVEMNEHKRPCEVEPKSES